MIINDPEFVSQGALAAVGIGWHQSGYAAGLLAARVLRGESPRNIPIEELAVKKLVLNRKLSLELGIPFPPSLLAQAGP